MNAYIDKVYASEQVRIYTEQLRTILGAKYEKVDLNKVIKKQCQHLT